MELICSLKYQLATSFIRFPSRNQDNFEKSLGIPTHLYYGHKRTIFWKLQSYGQSQIFWDDYLAMSIVWLCCTQLYFNQAKGICANKRKSTWVLSLTFRRVRRSSWSGFENGDFLRSGDLHPCGGDLLCVVDDWICWIRLYSFELTDSLESSESEPEVDFSVCRFWKQMIYTGYGNGRAL